MADQVADLQNFNVSAIAIEPGTSPDTIRDIKFGKYSIIFMSPESATSPHWRNILLSEDLKPRICVFACDEAHCISEWFVYPLYVLEKCLGEDFRPSYKEVLCLRSIIEAPVLAITGTCDEKVKKDIFSSLALTDEVSVIAVVPDRSVSATALLYVHFKDALRERGTPDGLIDMYHRSIDDENLHSYHKMLATLRYQ
uniref:Werner syndrome ATP-dependent helicase-like protein n=1 Tax=Magallana gigas TaxID=29159 RepID=K1PYQ8_MAGGI